MNISLVAISIQCNILKDIPDSKTSQGGGQLQNQTSFAESQDCVNLLNVYAKSVLSMLHVE